VIIQKVRLHIGANSESVALSAKSYISLMLLELVTCINTSGRPSRRERDVHGAGIGTGYFRDFRTSPYK
jgi:hypothetical protein